MIVDSLEESRKLDVLAIKNSENSLYHFNANKNLKQKTIMVRWWLDL